jgi:hypothetical protein
MVPFSVLPNSRASRALGAPQYARVVTAEGGGVSELLPIRDPLTCHQFFTIGEYPPFATHSIAGLELPSLSCRVGVDGHNPISVAAKVLRFNWTPHAHGLIR